MNSYWVYIATSPNHSVLYTGVTNDINRRMAEHKNKATSGFTSHYNVNKLLYCEKFSQPDEAIAAEKRIKGWTRIKKIRLIQTINPALRDILRND